MDFQPFSLNNTHPCTTHNTERQLTEQVAGCHGDRSFVCYLQLTAQRALDAHQPPLNQRHLFTSPTSPTPPFFFRRRFQTSHLVTAGFFFSSFLFFFFNVQWNLSPPSALPGPVALCCKQHRLDAANVTASIILGVGGKQTNKKTKGKEKV